MRVYLHYEPEEEGRKAVTIKVKLPKKWVTGPTDNLKETIVDNVNKKLAAEGASPAPQVDAADFHLALKDGTALFSDEAVNKRIPDRADVYLIPGASQTVADAAEVARKVREAQEAAEAADPMLTCKNFGCNKKYRESENVEGVCVCHDKPPIFHETKKMWSCCGASAYDWDSFMSIKGCVTRKHSTEPPAQLFLGGADVRNEYEPKRIDAGEDNKDNASSAPAAPQSSASTTAGRIATPLTKIQALRKALVSVGVTGATFDLARDAIKARHEGNEDADQIWLATMEDLSSTLGEALENLYD